MHIGMIRLFQLVREFDVINKKCFKAKDNDIFLILLINQAYKFISKRHIQLSKSCNCSNYVIIEGLYIQKLR